MPDDNTLDRLVEDAPNQDVATSVRHALETLFTEDAALWDLGVHEIAVAHRLALYLEGKFEGLKVDLEYNKAGKVTKRGLNGDLFRPDIVVHNRGTDDKNQLVIELKVKNADTEHDSEKLREMTACPRNYIVGLSLVLETPTLTRHQWFSRGQKYPGGGTDE